jgi:hypothetical protein
LVRFYNRLLSAADLLGEPRWACPAPCFNGPLRTFENGPSIPGNLGYFKVLADDPGELSLKTEDGKAIPANARMIGPDRVYAPIQPIAADSVVLLTLPANGCAVDDGSKVAKLPNP